MPFSQDLRYGLRVLVQSPVATAVAVLALALGIGVNISSFVAVNAMVLHPFSFPHLERIMTVWETVPKSTNDRDAFAPANYLDWKEQSRSFQEVAAYQGWAANLTGMKDPTRLQASLVSAEFFKALGMQPALGRTFTSDEAGSQRSRVVIVSDGFWREHLAGAPDPIGKSISLNGQNYTVLGVMPADFDYPLTNEVWAPLAMTTADEGKRTDHRLQLLALLKPDVSLGQAREEAKEIAVRLEQQYPVTNQARSISIVPIGQLTNAVADRFILLLLGSATFVLLLACANVANLQLARAAVREKEIAVRAALGASRFQIAWQLIIESLLTATGGGIAALLLASWNLDFTKARIPAEAFAFVAGLRTMHIDATTVAYTFVISLVTGILASIPAILQLLRQRSCNDLTEALQQGGRNPGASGGRNRLQSALIVYEVSMALVLLIGASLMVQGFNSLLTGSYGYDPKNVLRLQVSLPAGKYDNDPQVVSFYDRVLERFQMLPGTRAAAIWSDGPDTRVFIEGRPSSGPGEFTPEVAPVSSGFLESMHMPLLQGRFLSERDRPRMPAVAVLSAAVAHYYWPNSDATGHRIKLGSLDSPWVTVVGVSGDIVRDWLTNRPERVIYVPYTQNPPLSTTFVIRTSADLKQAAFAAQESVRRIDKELPIYAVKSMDRFLFEQMSGVRAAADAMTRYAVVALLLAATGIFGVISYFVAQRTRDIGVRMALGADTTDVLFMTVRRTLRPTFLGILIGTGEAYGLSRLMSSLLFGIVTIQAVTFVCSAVLLAIAAFLASYIPARRATRIDPLLALRES